MAHNTEEAIRRIMEMEARFDRVLSAPDRQDPAIREDLAALERYLESGQWLADYTLDEQGLLPQGLKRGVLSQDGLYDLLTET